MFQDSSSDEDEVGASAPAPAKATTTIADDESDDEPVAAVKADPDEDKSKDNSKSAFDEDSDDDDAEFDDKKKSNDSAESAEKKAELALGDSDDDDDDDDEAKETKSKKDEKKKSILDSDSDEGDEEFDDGGAVVGSAAPAQSATKEGASTATTPGSEGASAPKHSSKPPQKATVLEVDRPEKNVSFYMTKLPNVLGIQSSAFDESTYNEADEEQQYQGYVHNMVRWRYKQDDAGNMARDDDGKLIRESNTKLVKWSDGSHSMHIGNETFDIQAIDSSSNGFTGLNGYIYLSQKSTFSNEGQDEETPGGTVLECMGPVTSRFVTKPSSLQSESHKSLTVAVRQKTIKKARIAEYVTQEDPEKMKQERIRINQDESKIQSRKRSNYKSYTARRTPGMNSRYLEDDDDNYDSINIKAVKKGVAMDDDMDDYGDDSDGDDDGYNETFRSRTRKGKRQKKVEEDEEEEELVFDAESDEDDVTLIKAHKKKRSHQAVLEDDDDDD
jgi:RNA polymerase-associated protein LEO1